MKGNSVGKIWLLVENLVVEFNFNSTIQSNILQTAEEGHESESNISFKYEINFVE